MDAPGALLKEAQPARSWTTQVRISKSPDNPWADADEGNGRLSRLAVPGSPAVTGGVKVGIKKVTVLAIRKGYL